MAIAKIQCPNCHAKFTLKTESVSALAAKTFQCPKCATATPFARLLSHNRTVQALHTHIAGAANPAPPTKDGATRLAGPGGVCAELIVGDSGKSLKLGNGVYTLGRDSSDSKASLKVAPDKFMSRLHAQLSVDFNPTGSPTPVCLLSPLSANNPIFVNNKKLELGRHINLKNGDKILLGMTTLTIKI